MGEPRKRSVSMRLDVSDLARIKCIARRLRVRDSDVIRFAIKQALGQLSPLGDLRIKGRDLVPLFLEPGADVVRHFDMDAAKLDEVVNADIQDPAQRVATQDLHLLAMTMAMPPQTHVVQPMHSADLAPSPGGNGHSAATPVTDPGAEQRPRIERRTNPTRRYLYEKYLYRALD